MAAAKSSFLDKVLGRIGRLDTEGLQSVVQRLARERSFLETLFNTIEDGVLVVDESGRVLYFNQAVTRLLGLQHPSAEGQPISRFLPELDWASLARADAAGGARVSRHEFEVHYPRPLILHDATEARQRTHEAIESERTQALTLLAASVAHEIGNPLNALHIHLQLMERELKKFRSIFQNGPAGAPPAGRKKSRAEPASRDALELVQKLEKYLSVAKGEIGRL